MADDRSYRRTWVSWVLYDVGNSAFFLVIVAAVFPFFYQDVYVHGRDEPGLRIRGGAALAWTAGIAMIFVALLGPLLGAVADRLGSKKRFLAAFGAIGVAASVLMFFIGPGEIVLASGLYALGTIAMAGSLVFYDALLPAVARREDLDRISAIGYAAGYGGSVILLVLNLLWILHPGWFGLSDAGQAARLSFVSVGVWWALFTIPLLRNVPEPPPPAAEKGNVLAEGFRQLGRTVRTAARHKQLVLFLAAFWLYSDGIGTIMKLGASFGYSLGLTQGALLGALIVAQIVGIPCAIGFSLLARRIGGKAAILAGLVVYAAICVLATWMETTWHFYAMAVGVGLVQGGTQALSRSVFATLIPKARAAEFFGFFSTLEKLSGIAGIFLLALLWGGENADPRRGVAVLALFFVAGGALLWKVDVEAGRRAAEEEDAAA